MEDPTVPGSSFSIEEGFQFSQDLVEGRANVDLSSDPAYKAGWKQCHESYKNYLKLLLEPKAVQVRFAGNA